MVGCEDEQIAASALWPAEVVTIFVLPSRLFQLTFGIGFSLIVSRVNHLNQI